MEIFLVGLVGLAGVRQLEFYLFGTGLIPRRLRRSKISNFKSQIPRSCEAAGDRKVEGLPGDYLFLGNFF